MRTIYENIYKFDELSENAQRRAWENGPDFSGDYSDEYRATLAAFERAFDIKVYRYNIGYPGTNYAYVKAGPANEAPENDPLRLARYMWNNYADEIRKGKYYSTRGRYIDGKYHYKYRYSKIRHEMNNCPLTGVCTDYYILQPVIDCLLYKRFFNDIDELLEECLDAFFAAWERDIEYCSSFEHFAEIAEINEYEFYESGEMYA